jgi:NADH pyrophosphatase NudC (nudix superfamily)
MIHPPLLFSTHMCGEEEEPARGGYEISGDKIERPLLPSRQHFQVLHPHAIIVFLLAESYCLIVKTRGRLRYLGFTLISGVRLSAMVEKLIGTA